ncbi:MAG: nucleotidyltransferase family protein [Gemmatimonadetes bacterium]|uniref:Nucleotidyltransferase family protein n=1 Tax=Candidatus Kutchimonas denitrificans TaxID=3056748 RepID=A0AAE4Z9J4_9BACT|nr:nucleotidyltransferase family protein [Gemmatimonadota bacterium]NIR74661.1 nucleotidyltransferase family protein [Candidatus Kutchimonas denitrificans]NIS01411.1 nucleotidyltransferase family protein [Gemmatimonadota bacterium]NIT67152.1 nucleotidyltransferase family protein [Gemmatimonadota bacterium]NIU52326.1 NTP transferase domain-containing protein [Gemmatimonadota bacterium]
MIVGIVLAGGRSRRMGRPKFSLPIGDDTFLSRGVRTLSAGGCEEVVVVSNPEEPAAAELLPLEAAGPRLVEGAKTEQIDSLRSGLRALPKGTEAAVVLPVDHPLVEPGTVKALIEAFRAGGAPIVRPTHEGRYGHPVLFAAALFDELLNDELPEGARTVVRRHADRSVAVAVEDRGVLIDVDTPEEFDEHVAEDP